MNTYAWYFKIKNVYKIIYGCNYQCKKHRKNCETALIRGIPSIPGIQDIPIWFARNCEILTKLRNLVEIVKFGWSCEIW